MGGIQNQIDAQANNIDTLYDGMMTLEQKIVEAKGKKNQMIARARTAKSTQTMNDMMLPSSSKGDKSSTIEAQFRMLEASDSVDKELEKLRANLLPPAVSTSPAVQSVARQIKIVDV